MIDRIATALANMGADGCEVTDGGGSIAACVGPCRCREFARAAIAAIPKPTPVTIDLRPGQIWFPAPGKRAKAREIVRIGERHGYPHVFWMNCGHTGISPIRIEGFRAWVRKHGATVAIRG